MKTLKLIIVLITGLSLMNTVLSEPKFNQPLYSLEFNIYGTGAEIRLNDIPVYYHDTEGQTSSQKPIPESIINGENILSIKSFPLKDNENKYQENAYIEAIISIREKDAPLNENKPVLQLKLSPTNQEDKILEGTISSLGEKAATVISHSKLQTIAERRTHIESPFPRWAWQDGQIIENNEDNYTSLLDEYQKIWNTLNSGDMDKIKKLYDPAAQEFAWAYHYDDKQHGHRLMNTGGFLKEPEWKLGDIKKFIQKRKYILKVHANGLIAEILDTQDNKSPIMYLNPNTRLISFQKFGFYKNKEDKWVMIR